MLAINPGVEILASPWTAPAWMKANHRLTNVLKRGTLLPNAYGPFARYFVKFIEAYAAAGVPIQAVTPQNEPQLPVNYPGMTLTEPMEARFITHDLKPALSRAGLRTRIYGFDFNWFLTGYPRALVSDRAVLRDIAGLAWHCYVGRASDMTTLHRLAPRLDELETECSSGISAGPASELVIASTRNWAASVVLWNLALDTKGGPHLPQSGCQGCTAIATVDPRAQTVSYGHDYYELGQASAFVERGAWRIASNNFVQYRFVFKTKDGPYESPGLDDVAFENPDGTIVLLAFNNSRHPIRFAVSWRGRSFRYTLPSAATVTFTWR
jgi:O-glycosyl hydrolase